MHAHTHKHIHRLGDGKGLASLLKLFFMTGTYEVASLVTEVLKELLSNEQACKTCLFQEDIVAILLSPLAQLLDETSVSGRVSESE